MSDEQMKLPLGVQRARAHIAAQAAADAADRRDPKWSERAFTAFVSFARAYPERKFTTNDVRTAAKDVPPPPDSRAWGAVAVRAKREGIVVSVGLIYQADGLGKHNPCPKTLWQLKQGLRLS